MELRRSPDEQAKWRYVVRVVAWWRRGRFAAAALLSAAGLATIAAGARAAGEPLLLVAVAVAIATLAGALVLQRGAVRGPRAATCVMGAAMALDLVIFALALRGAAWPVAAALVAASLASAGGVVAASLRLAALEAELLREELARACQAVREPLGIVRARADAVRLELAEPVDAALGHDLALLAAAAEAAQEAVRGLGQRAAGGGAATLAARAGPSAPAVRRAAPVGGAE